MAQRSKNIIPENKRIIFLGILLGMVFWINEGIIDAVIFHKWTIADALLPKETHELWLRSFVTCIFIGFGFYAQLIINKLHVSRERYRALFENAPDAIFLADPESGQILDANPAASDLLLRPHQEIIKLHQAQLHPPAKEKDSKNIFSEHVEKIAQEEKQHPLENVAFRSDGVEVPVEITAQIVNIGGRPVLQGIFRDITKWMKAKNELEKSNERFRTLLDSLDALVYVSDMDTHEILFINKYGRDIFGDITGKTCWKVLQSGKTGPCEFCTNDRLLDDNGEPTGIYRWELQNTVNHQWYDSHDQAVPWTDGRIVRIEIATNITELKRTETALQKHTQLLDAIRHAQSLYITQDEPKQVFNSLLNTLVKMTDSEYGFLDDVLKDDDGSLYKKSLALSNIAWDQDSQNLYKKLKSRNLEFRNMHNLSGAPALTGELVISNDPSHDSRSGGIPEGHPPLHSFMGIPMFFGGELVGVAGIANRKDGYSEELASFLDTFISTCAGIIHDVRNDKRKKEITEALRYSEEKYRRIVEDQTEFILRWRPDGIRTFVNDSYCNYFSKSREELIGSSFFPFILEEDWEKVRERIESFSSDNTVSTGEYRVIRPDGSIGWNQWTDRAIFDESGHIIEFQSTGRDITDRKKAEEQLAIFKKFTEASAQGLSMADLDGRIVYCNESLSRVFLGEDKPEDILGKEVSLYYNPQSREKLETEILPSVLKEGEWAGELPIVSINGKVTPAIQSIFLIHNDIGEPTHFANIVTDITERKRAEELLRQSNNLLRESQEVARLGHYMLNFSSGLWESSDILDSIFGIGGDYPKNIDGWLQIVHRDQRDEMSAYFSQVVVGQGQPFDREYMITHVSNQQVRWVHGLGKLEFDKEGKLVRMVGTIQDITERKKVEEKLIENQAQLRSLVSQLTMTEESERKELAGILHDDLIQRLVMCKMRLDELGKSQIPMSRGNSLDEIGENIREMIKGTRSLTFDLFSPVLYDIGLEAAIRDWLDREVKGKYNIKFEFEEDGQQRQMSEELRVMLYRAVRELSTNVIKHSKANKAKISVRNKIDTTEIIVEDNGVGIMIDSTMDDSGERGGLGLFGVRERLGHFGASMNLESDAAGTRITITVPLDCQDNIIDKRS
ncbi:MAG: PAS domain S-box protein [Sedimentisphaerales bacterium]|nr:PAS domain S-box protein [Sedimentisphaerales bacterium]